jgi:hypothetical protein
MTVINSHRDAGAPLKLGILILMLVTTGFLPPVASGLDIDHQWGGHLRGQGLLSWPDPDAVILEEDMFTDGVAELRLKSTLFLGDRWDAKVHYEAFLTGGDTRRNAQKMAAAVPGTGPTHGPPTDDHRLFDLTSTLDSDENHALYHRLDRLSLTWIPDWGAVTLGRQALTWGNGLIFNPMDLFNPFRPTDFNRDYKTGDDMALIRITAADLGDIQLLGVPRRDPATGEVEWDHSSLAGKFHFTKHAVEVDLMAARHYESEVLGAGAMGYLFNAAWRADATWTLLDARHDRTGFLSLVANLDYSWVWGGRNFYGLVEGYYNGLGEDDYSEALSDPAVSDRLSRGEMFTLGRSYLAGQLQMEAHPLVNLYLLLIQNMADPSGVIQPRVVWDSHQSLRWVVGASLYYGDSGTEYGGFSLPGTDLRAAPANQAFLWLTWYF